MEGSEQEFDIMDVQTFLNVNHIENDKDLMDFYLNHLFDDNDLSDKDKQILDMLVEKGVPSTVQESSEDNQQESQKDKQPAEDKQPDKAVRFDDEDVRKFLEDHQIANEDDLMDFYLNHLFDDAELTEKEKQIFNMLVETGIPHMVQEDNENESQAEVKPVEEKPCGDR